MRPGLSAFTIRVAYYATPTIETTMKAVVNPSEEGFFNSP